jgi:hypothetical protein
VSTYAGSLESAAAVHPETVLERRLTRYLIVIAGVVTGVGGFTLLATSDHLVDPFAYGLQLADLIVGTSLARSPSSSSSVTVPSCECPMK